MMFRVAPLLALLPAFSLAARAPLGRFNLSQFGDDDLHDPKSFRGHAAANGPAAVESHSKDPHEEQEVLEYAWAPRPEMMSNNSSHKDVDKANAKDMDKANGQAVVLPVAAGGFEFINEKVVNVMHHLAPYRFTVMGMLICFVFYVSAGGVTPPVFIVYLCFSYSSISMSMLNKHAVAMFPYTALLVALQMLATVLVLLLVQGRSMRMGRTADMVRWSGTTLLYAGVLASGLWALKVTTISTVMVLRNILPLFTLFVEKVWMKSSDPITVSVISSMLLTAGGTFIYAHDNMSVSREAAGYVLLNCVMVVLDRIVQRGLLADPEFSLSPSVCLLINNGLGAFVMVLLALGSGELRLWPSALWETSRTIWFWICLTGINGCVLGYVSVQCQKMVSATSFLVLQNATKVVLILLSVAIFRDRISGVSLAGTALSMLGCAWYGTLRLPAASPSSSDRRVPGAASCAAGCAPSPSSASLREPCPLPSDEDASDSTADTRPSRH